MNPLKARDTIQKQECRLMLLASHLIGVPTMKHKASLLLNQLVKFHIFFHFCLELL